MMTVLFRVILVAMCCYFSVGVMPVYGEICRVYDQQTICLVAIKRSAKYYWEYRAVLRVDGKKLPQKTFDCLHDLELANAQRKFVCSVVPKRD